LAAAVANVVGIGRRLLVLAVGERPAQSFMEEEEEQRDLNAL
jgi:hypothetical protein